MIRRAFRLGLTLGVLAAVAYAVMRLLEPRSSASAPPSPDAHEPWPALTSDPARPERPSTHMRPDPAASGTRPWVEPAEGACPISHPVKAKLTSRIFHLPGMANYERTNADRCYLDGEHAEADGLRAAKR